MSDDSKIEWTDATWNPVTGCTEVSPGCDHCYAKTFAERWRGVPGHHFERGFDVTLRPERLDQPMRWRKPRRIFVNSMSDLFHDEVPTEFVVQVFAVMALAPQHTFQLLTKRHGRMRSLLSSEPFAQEVSSCITGWAMNDVPPPLRKAAGGSNWYGAWPLPNVWLGVSVENQQWADIRIPALLGTSAVVRFLSCEPLLGPVDLDLPSLRAEGAELYTRAEYIDWVIVGGESGHGARPMHPQWVRGLRDQCRAGGVAFHFKQWGEWVPEDQAPTDAVIPARFYRDDATGGIRLGKGKAGRELDGRTWDEYPESVPA
jgi:protein gp37